MSATADVDRPLAGLLILDLVQGPLAPLTRLFGDLGAELVRIEPADARGPQDPRGRLADAIGNLGKEIQWLDPARPDDVAAFEGLARRAHMIVRSADMAGTFGLETIAAARPELVLLDVSLFGRGNSYADWQATDPVLQALSGMLCRSGLEGSPPLIPPGSLAISCAFAQAAVAGLAALYQALRTGQGDRIDAAALDGAAMVLEPGFGMSGTAAMGTPAKLLPRGRPAQGVRYPIFRCADGYVRICVLAARQWQAMFRWMGEPAAFADPRFNDMFERFNTPALNAAIGAFFADKSRGDLERQAQACGVPLAALRTLEDCLSADHLETRRALVSASLGDGRRVKIPNGVVEIDGARMGPRLGPVSQAEPTAFPVPSPSETLPLAGLKVLDLGVIIVGAEQARLLADLGADVVKVESALFPDGARQASAIGLSQSFAIGHRNKRSLGLNLRSAEGKALFRRLAAQADLVLSNFKPGTLESLGIGHDALAASNPALITLESSAFGSNGPWAERMGYGPLVRAVAGVTEAWRYQDDPESFSDSLAAYPDHVAARLCTAAILALLIRRLRTGRGGAAKVAQLDVILDHLAPDIAQRALGEPDEPPDAPWGVFPAAGDDEWCVVTVRDDADWRRLAPIIGQDPALTRTARLAARSALEAALSAWLAALSPQDAMERLQAVGVPAGRMLRVGDLPEFGYYQERQVLRPEAHPYCDQEILAERFLARAEHLGEPPARPAPLMGEHTVEVMRDWLGLDESEIARLIAAGTLEPTPPEILGRVEAEQNQRRAAHA